MNIVSFRDFQKLTMRQIKEMVPILMTGDGEPFVLVDKPENIIVTSDLNIRVRNFLKGREVIARRGMPKPERTYREQIDQVKQLEAAESEEPLMSSK